MTNVNGYVIYPESIGVMDLEKAKAKAAELSVEDPKNVYRVEDCDTQAIVARYFQGEQMGED